MYLSVFLLIITSVSSIIFSIKWWKLTKEKNTFRETLQKSYDLKISDLQAEIKRLNYIINDYREKYMNKRNELNDNAINNSEAKQESQNTSSKTEDILYEKNLLEKEKSQFQEKTKKLWEQSLAIHREKERIDAMRREIETTYNQVTDSINYAKSIQTALLPTNDYLQELLPEHFVFFKPRNIVSGDFYWVKKIDTQIVVAAADCTGHGVPGAFMSMLGIALLNEIVNYKAKPDAAIILENLRKEVILLLKQDNSANKSHDGMDMSLCIIDLEDKQLQYAGAYNSIYHISNGLLTEYKATLAPVGIFIVDRKFENHTINFQSGDYIYMFSDGYSDQFGGKSGQKLKAKGFKELLTTLSTPENTMQQICEKVEQTHNDWKSDRFKQVDDILVLGMRF